MLRVTESEPRTFEISPRIRSELYAAGWLDADEVAQLRADLEKTRDDLKRLISAANKASVDIADCYARIVDKLEDSESTIAIVTFEPNKQIKPSKSPVT